MKIKLIAAAMAALMVGGCGASATDRDGVALGLETLDASWRVKGVELTSVESEGLSKAVYASLDHAGAVGKADLRDVIAAALTNVDASASWSLTLTITEDGEFPDLKAICDELAGPGTLGSACDHGRLNAPVSDYAAVLDGKG